MATEKDKKRQGRDEEVVLASDGLPALKVGTWWRDKHFYVQRYMDIFNVAMYQKWKHRPYIELFAGPGRCVIEDSQTEIDGSPIVAFRGRKLFTDYFFMDASLDFIMALKSRVDQIGQEDVRYFTGDCNALVSELTKALPEERSLGLAFVDPYNWEINFETLKILTIGRRLDLMITFHTGHIRRWVEKMPHEFDAFFGDSGWYEEYRTERRRHQRVRALLNAYEKRLRGLGYLNIDDEVIVSNKQRGLLYHLIFASKSPLGKEFWRKISKRSWSGQGKLF